MPPVKFSLSDKLKDCDSHECVEKLVDEYLTSLVSRGDQNEGFKNFYIDEDEEEKLIANSYRFSEALIQRSLLIDIDIEFIIRDLENRLGKSHPVVIFLRHFIEE